MNKTDILKVITISNRISSAITEKLLGYPDGCLVEVKNILDNKLPTMARQIDLVCPVETIREVINYAEGYEGCIAFPERGVRSIIKEGLDTLQKRVLDMVNSVINLVVKEVQECVREECSQENLQFEGGISDLDNDFGELLVRQCTYILHMWSAQCTAMVNRLIAMEHELPDTRMLRQLIATAEATTQDEKLTPLLDQDAPPLEHAPSVDSMRYVMGYLHKKEKRTGGWSQRWCVVQPQTRKLFVHKDPSKPPVHEIDLSRLQLHDHPSHEKSRSFILKPVDPAESALSSKYKSELCFKAPSAHVKELWVRSLTLLCNTKQLIEEDTAPTEKEKPVEYKMKIPSMLHADQCSLNLMGEENSLQVDPDLKSLSLALGEYLSIVRDHLVVFAVPKAVLHLFVSNVVENLKDVLVDKLVENF